MADAPRPTFRPQRARASLGAVPSASYALTSTVNKENPSTSRDDSTTPAPGSDAPSLQPSTAQKRTKKRAQSLGGDALEMARKRLQLGDAPRLEMSPGKLERRQRAPRRSILKQTPAKFDEIDHTFTFSTSSNGRITRWEEAHAQTTDLSGLSAFNSAAGPSSSGPAPPPAANGHLQRRRSSLKRRSSVASGNYDDSDAQGSDMDEEDEVSDDYDDPNGSLDMDVTRFENDTALYDINGGRKSVAHSRRVSFAPSAAIRTFTPDKPTAEAQAYEAARRQLEAEAAEAAATNGEPSLTYLSDDADDLAAEHDADDTGADESEASMEIAGDEVTLAFRGHFAGTQIPVSALQEDDDEHDEGSSLERSMDEDEDGTMAMDEVTDGVTSAFAAHFAQPAAAASSSQEAGEGGFDASVVHARAQAETTPAFPLFGAASSASSSAAAKAADIAQAYKRAGPRPSELARQEDEDDEAVMRELGFARGGRPRKSRVGSTIVEEDEDEDDENDSEGEVDMEDATGAMDMTTAIGGIVQAASSQEGSAVVEEEDDDEEMDSDAEVSFQLISGERTVDMTFATDADGVADQDDEPVEQEQDDPSTAEATTSSAILPQPPPAAPARTFNFGLTTAAATARQSLGPSLSAPPHPFERAGSAPPFQAPSPHKSAADRAAAYVSPVRPTASSSSSSYAAARPSLGRALSVPLEAAGGARTPTRSPFLGGRGSGRFSTSPAPPGARSSPFRSPRRVPFDSPRAGTSSLPASMLGAAAKSPGHARRELSPAKGAPSSSLAEVEKEGATAASLNGLDAKEQQPPASPGITMRSRSRSRSRSMSPVKQAPATPGRAVFQPRSLAPPLSVGRSPGGSLSLRALLVKGGGKDEAGSAGDKRVAELKGGADGDELNLTGTSFDGSFSHDNDTPALPASLDAFFTLTGTSFVNDVVALVDVEKSAANRRKSMAAPSTDARGPCGPPTFADLHVIGSYKNLVHRLYTSESQGLSEQIDELQHVVRQQEETIRQGAVPPIFRTWTTASEEAKNVIKTQLGQIKLHYLLTSQLEFTSNRLTNFGQIVDAMEQSFVEVQNDRALLARSKLATVIPDLETRHASLHAELDAERQLDAQLSALSPDDLEFRQSLLADSEEQEEQLNGNAAKGIAGQRPELDRIKQHLISYEETFDKYSTEEQRLAAEIAMLEDLRRDKRSKADLVRLRADFDALQHLQGWTLVRFDPAEVEMRCGDEFVVRLGFEKEGTLAVIEAPCEMVPLPRKMAGSLSAQVTAALLTFLNKDIEHKLAKRSVDARVLLRYIGARATMLRHVRQEIVLASLRYPTTLSLAATADPSSTPTLHIDVFCASSRKGFVVAVPLSGDMLEAHEPEKWAAESASAAVDARFGFAKGGSVNALALAQTVNDRLSAGYGRSALLDAVVAAEEEADRA
ncbi:hypothetical protein JCM9279_003125 [Rhodotorula babjevae]